MLWNSYLRWDSQSTVVDELFLTLEIMVEFCNARKSFIVNILHFIFTVCSLGAEAAMNWIFEHQEDPGEIYYLGVSKLKFTPPQLFQ